MNKKKKIRKLTKELFIILILSALLSLGCVLWLYNSRMAAYDWALDHNLVENWRDKYIWWISKEAPEYELLPLKNLKETAREEAAREALPFLFQNRDKYTGINIYDNGDGLFVVGDRPEIFDNSFWFSWIWSDADIIAMGNETVEVNVKFKDCTANIIVSSYRVLEIIPVYMGFAFAFCVTVFLAPVIVFVRRRMAYMSEIRSEVLVMAEGDLEHPLTVKGRDEIASMAEELDYLRQALKENIEKERESRQANQELIRAMSHDLRTPLTTLYGYLEILGNAKGNSEKYPEYIRRCLSKTEEIRGMSDKMFEYALVFDGREEVGRETLPIRTLWKELEEQGEYLKTQGFSVEMEGTCLEGEYSGNAFLIKRLLGNLFSNIVRYGAQSEPVHIKTVQSGDRAEIVLQNGVRSEKEAVGSGVGLKSARRIAALHEGELNWEETGGYFQVTFWLPVQKEG